MFHKLAERARTSEIDLRLLLPLLLLGLALERGSPDPSADVARGSEDAFLSGAWPRELTQITHGVPAVAVTIERRAPLKRLNNVDFPTLGRPTSAMTGFMNSISNQLVRNA